MQFKAAGAPLPAPIYTGTRSILYRWFARIYEPAHAPALRTQMWCEFEVEVFHDEDYAEFSTRCSSMIVRMVTRPAAAASGLPP